MREMKNSGIAWVGMVPKEWTINPANGLFSEIKEKNSNLKYTKALQFKYGAIIEKPSNDKQDESALDTLQTYSCVEPNTIMINGLNLNYDFISQRVGMVTTSGVITSAYLAVKPDEQRIIPAYANYLLKGYDSLMVFHGMESGVRKTLQWKDFKNIMFILPSMVEQKKIVEVIDNDIQKVDALIANQEAQIEKLKAYKQSLITEVVTKGLDPNVPLKDSGVEWIGEIPKDWDVIGIKYTLDKNHPYPIGDGDHGLIGPSDYMDNGIPYIRVQNLGWGTELLLDNLVYISEENNNRIKNSTLRPNDILFAKTGATIGKTGMIPSNMPISNTTSHVGKLTIDDRYNPRFVFYVLSSYIGFRQFWEIACQNTTRPELGLSKIRSICLLVPQAKSMQDKIVSFLDEKLSKADRLIQIKQAKIEKLNQYKKSLIYEYVTGKKEVNC